MRIASDAPEGFLVAKLGLVHATVNALGPEPVGLHDAVVGLAIAIIVGRALCSRRHGLGAVADAARVLSGLKKGFRPVLAVACKLLRRAVDALGCRVGGMGRTEVTGGDQEEREGLRRSGEWCW